MALCVTARAMDLLNRPRTDIIAITMPCFGTTQRTKSNAEILAQRLGVTLERVDIAKQVLQHFEDIGHSRMTKTLPLRTPRPAPAPWC